MIQPPSLQYPYVCFFCWSKEDPCFGGLSYIFCCLYFVYKIVPCNSTWLVVIVNPFFHG